MVDSVQIGHVRSGWWVRTVSSVSSLGGKMHLHLMVSLREQLTTAYGPAGVNTPSSWGHSAVVETTGGGMAKSMLMKSSQSTLGAAPTYITSSGHERGYLHPGVMWAAGVPYQGDIYEGDFPQWSEARPRVGKSLHSRSTRIWPPKV